MQYIRQAVMYDWQLASSQLRPRDREIQRASRHVRISCRLPPELDSPVLALVSCNELA